MFEELETFGVVSLNLKRPAGGVSGGHLTQPSKGPFTFVPVS